MIVHLSQIPTNDSKDKTSDSGVVISHSQKQYYESEQGKIAREALQDIVNSPSYTTNGRAHEAKDTDFVERHMQYLSTHRFVDLNGYLSNLRLMTKSKKRN
jgi:hypothetical protein